MADTPDKGNPNFWTSFKGRYQLIPSSGVVADTDVVMLSCTNDVQVIGDFDFDSYTAKTVFATLPEEVRPNKFVSIPVCVYASIDDCVPMSYLNILTVSPNGEMVLEFGFNEQRKLYMSGVNFNISDRWY